MAATVTEPAVRILTFLFTDVEGSTRLWEQFPDAMPAALARHDAILRRAVEGSRGHVVKTTGDGFMAVFGSARDGVGACLRAQLDLETEAWPDTDPIRARMALHSGEAAERDGDYFGPTLNRAARIMAAGHGGQILLSAAAAALAADQLPPGARLLDLGEHRLKDLGRPERVFQLVGDGLPSAFRPLVTVDRERPTLPVPPSAFVGREEESQRIGALLGDDQVRLLTLIGPGGIGKTRLALRATSEVADRFPDGVYFVDLSAIRDSEAALAAVGRAVGLDETHDGSRFDELARHLGDQRVLLLLDNFEQVMSAAPVVAQLVDACPGLTVLVTSREALRVRGERLFSVPPLSLPHDGEGSATAERLSRFEAIQLFVERARAVRSDFNLTDDNAAAVAAICRHLDGLPLAIELAAARINLFSPEALRQRLESGIDVLKSTARDLPERQQTLRAAIDWSYRLLEPDEQLCFEMLAAFSSATFMAVESVAAGVDALDRPGFDALDGVASLVDKSLLRHTDPGVGEPRMVMLETIHEFAADRLGDRPGFAAEVFTSHATYFADAAAGAWRLTEDERRAALELLGPDLANLEAAWRYWVGQRDLARLDQMLECLSALYDRLGRYRPAVELAGDVLGVLATMPESAERRTRELVLRTMQARALMASEGYSPEIEAAYTRALAPFADDEDIPQIFPVLRGLATYYQFRAEFDKCAQVGRNLLRLAEAQDDDAMRVDGQLVLGSSLAFSTDMHAGLDHLDTAIRLFEAKGYHARRFRVGNDTRVACYTTSAFMLWLLGSPDRALERAERAHALATRLDHPLTLAYALFHIGFLHIWRNEPLIARDRAVAAFDVAQEHDLRIWQAAGTCLLGAATTELGRHEEGLALVRQGITDYMGLRTPPVFWPLLDYLRARAYLAAGQVAQGMELIDEGIEILVSGGRSGLLPELLVVKGHLLMADGDHRAAEAMFERAAALARELGATMPELRACTGLWRARRELGELGDASKRLEDVLAMFTEGSDTVDLREASALVEGERAA